MTLFIRPAKKEDAVLAAILLAETHGDFGLEVIGLGDADLQVKALQTWFTDAGNRFSFEQTLIAENYGIAVGLLLGFPGSLLGRLNLGIGRRLFAIYGFVDGVRMVWRNWSLVRNKEAEHDEYLIANLAVEEQFRRQGIARKLINEAEKRARTLGFSKIVLEVEFENERAINLYRSSGFKVVKTLYFHDAAGKLKSTGYYKMSKSI